MRGKFKLPGNFMQNFTKHLLNKLINVHYNFNDFNSKNDKRYENLDESLITELLDMRD